MNDLKVIHAKCKEIFIAQLIEAGGGRSFACKMWDIMTDKKIIVKIALVKILIN